MRGFVGIQSANARPMQDGRVVAHAFGSEKAGDVRVNLPRGAGIESVALAESGHHDPRGAELAERVDEGILALLARNVALFYQVAYRAVQGGVHGSRRATGPGDALEQVHYYSGVVAVRDVSSIDIDLHICLLVHKPSTL